MADHEVDGINYYFITQQEFNKKVRDGEFMSVTAILGKSYGFSKWIQMFLKVDPPKHVIHIVNM